MKYAIVVSTKDQAGMNIKENLLKNYDFEEKEDYYEKDNVKLYTVEKDSIYCEGLDVDADVIIFATKHQSAAGTTSLSIHVPGNWNKAEVGGEDRTLDVAPASLVKEMFLELNKQGESFEGEITLEVTHHGPKVQKSVMFIEIGSSENEWTNPSYGEIISKTIMNVVSKGIKNYETVFAIGGGHYPRELNKVLLRTDLAIGHICPKYMLEKLDKDMIKQAIEKNVEGINKVLLDWKGLGSQKDRIIEILNELELNVEKVQSVLKKAKIE